MKIAVTGASGFVGRHVVAQLLSAGAEVIATSRSATPPFASTQGLAFVTLDMADSGANVYARLQKPDVLVHLAWGGLPNYKADTHLRDELPRQQAFLRTCIEGGLKRLVVTGTCLEYGMRSGMLDEDMAAAPCTAYAEAKHRLHVQLRELAWHGDLQLTWLRLFYLYGSGQAPTSLYAQLRKAVAEHRPEFAMSQGDQIRDFLPVETAASYICRIAQGEHRTDLVNICSGIPKKISDWVGDWLRDWHAAIELKLGVYPYPDYEPFEFWGSVQRLHSVITSG